MFAQAGRNGGEVSLKKIAVVTGASSGLGREYVLLIDRRSQTHPKDHLDEIWVIARRKERLEELSQSIKTPVRIISMDLTDPAFERRIQELYAAENTACRETTSMQKSKGSDLQNTAGRAPHRNELDDEIAKYQKNHVEKHDGKGSHDGQSASGNLDIRLLVNAAGYGKIGSYADVSNRDASGMVDLNCRAPVMMCQLSIPYMHEGARILNVCSTAGFSAFQYLGIYCATKAFLYRYSRALRVELFTRRISVTAVCPYWVKDTEFIPVAKTLGGKSETVGTRTELTLADGTRKDKPDEQDVQKGRTSTPGKTYIRHFPLSSKKKTVAAWSMEDTWHRFAVSTPGPVCILHRIFAKVIPNELMAGIWALLRRV